MKSYMGYNKGMKEGRSFTKSFLAPSKSLSYDILKDLPASVDWRTKGAVGPVRN